MVRQIHSIFFHYPYHYYYRPADEVTKVYRA